MTELRAGEFVAFINTKKTMIKLYAANNIIAHYKGTQKLDLNALAFIPKYFNGSELSYNKALKESLEKKLGKANITS